MYKIAFYIISVLTVFISCTSTDIPDKMSLQPQVMNDSLLTTMPGDLLLIDGLILSLITSFCMCIVLPMENISVLWGRRERGRRNL